MKDINLNYKTENYELKDIKLIDYANKEQTLRICLLTLENSKKEICETYFICTSQWAIAAIQSLPRKHMLYGSITENVFLTTQDLKSRNNAKAQYLKTLRLTKQD